MKRVEWVDTLKGIGIILMVLGHYPALAYTGRALILIYSFHMPLFLFVGGYLFSEISNRRELADRLRKNVRTLVVPYFAFSVVSLLFSWSAGPQNAPNYLYGIFFGLGRENIPNVPLWFFTFYFTGRCIFSGMLYVSNLVGRKSRNVKEGVLFLLTLCLIYIAYRFRLVYYSPRLPWNPDMSALCIGFYYMGYQFKQWKPKRTLPAILPYVVCGLAFLVWIPVALYGTRVDINASCFGRGIGYFYAAAMLGIIWCTGLAFLLAKQDFIRKVLGYLGKNSLFVVGLHIPMNYIAGAILLPYMPTAVQAAYNTKSVTGILYTVTSTILLSLMAGGLWKEAKKSMMAG